MTYRELFYKATRLIKDNAEYERAHSLQGCLEFSQLAEWLEQLQKIHEIIDNWTKPGEIEWAIREVLEDGNDDCD